jgi:hypothetical protein
MLFGKRIQHVIFQTENRFLAKASKQESLGVLDVEVFCLNITMGEVRY